MTTLKMREDINLLEVENIFFLLLHRNVATGLSLFVGYEIDRPSSSICLRIFSGAYIQSII